jgi:hypothetical protein
MKKLLFSIAALGLVVFVIWYFWPSTKHLTQTTPNGALPTAGNVASQGGGAVTIFLIQTEGGGSVQVKDPIADPLTYQDPFTPDHYYLGNHIQIGTTPDSTAGKNLPYIIEYIKSTQFFNIALLKEPLGASRLEAERYLLTHLGISKVDACKLKYSVAVPHWVNEQYAGIDLRFSFCPRATQLAGVIESIEQ